MTGSQYNNIIQGTLGDIGLEHADDSAYVAKKIFDNCGVAFPTGNSEAVFAVLQGNDYVGWRSCTAEEAQENANEGVAAVAIGNDSMTVIRPEERAVLVKSTFINSMANYGLARTADAVSVDDDEGVAFFAYSAAGVTVYPDIFASVSTIKTTKVTESQMRSNAKYIYSYLRNWGFTKQAACGVLGNMQQESYRLDPGIWQVLNDPNSGYGLVQWTPGIHFLDWAKNNGVISEATPAKVNELVYHDPKKLIDAQLKCLVRDGDGSACKRFYKPSETGWANHTGYEMTYAQYKKSIVAPATLAVVFCDHFERTKDEPSISDRKNYALQWYQYF